MKSSSPAVSFVTASLNNSRQNVQQTRTPGMH